MLIGKALEAIRKPCFYSRYQSIVVIQYRPFYKIRIEEDDNHINLIWVELHFCSHYKYNFIDLKLHHCGKCLKVVNIFLLLKHFYNLSNYISFNIVVNIIFSFEIPLCCQNIPIYWLFNQLPSAIFDQGVKFSLYCFFSLTCLRTLDSFFQTRHIPDWAFAFLIKQNKFLRYLSRYMSSCILEESLTRFGIRGILWDKKMRFDIIHSFILDLSILLR